MVKTVIYHLSLSHFLFFPLYLSFSFPLSLGPSLSPHTRITLPSRPHRAMAGGLPAGWRVVVACDIGSRFTIRQMESVSHPLERLLGVYTFVFIFDFYLTLCAAHQTYFVYFCCFTLNSYDKCSQESFPSPVLPLLISPPHSGFHKKWPFKCAGAFLITN